MTYQSFEDWLDSDDGPRYHDLSYGDLHNAFDAGMELGAEKEATLAITEEAVLKVIDTYTLGMYRPRVVKLRNKIKELFND
jgi:hypothetical protein